MKNNLLVVGVFAGALLIGIGGFWIGKTQSPSNPAPNVVTAGPQSTAKSGPGAPGPLNAGIAIEAAKVKSVRMAQGLTAVGSLR